MLLMAGLLRVKLAGPIGSTSASDGGDNFDSDENDDDDTAPWDMLQPQLHTIRLPKPTHRQTCMESSAPMSVIFRASGMWRFTTSSRPEAGLSYRVLGLRVEGTRVAVAFRGGGRDLMISFRC